MLRVWRSNRIYGESNRNSSRIEWR